MEVVAGVVGVAVVVAVLSNDRRSVSLNEIKDIRVKCVADLNAVFTQVLSHTYSITNLLKYLTSLNTPTALGAKTQAQGRVFYLSYK